MVPPTRRELLQVATASVACLSGCSLLAGDGTQAVQSPSNAPGTTDVDGNRLSDPSMVTLRGNTRRAPIHLGADGETDTPPVERRGSDVTTEVVTTRADGDALNVAEGFDSTDVTQFVSETEFDSQTLYLQTVRVRECFRLQLCQIRWTPSEIHADYARQLRPWDEECTVDSHVPESRLIRIPAALHADRVNSFGTSVSGSGRCDRGGRASAEGGGSTEQLAAPSANRGESR